MPYWRLFYHFVWGTKYGEPLIEGAFEYTLHRAIGAKVIELDGIAHAVGGVENHVHLVASVPPRIALSKFVGQIKGSTAHMVNHKIQPGYPFYWQDEYGVVSFGERHLTWVVNYALNQRERHRSGQTVSSMERVSDV